MNSWIEEKNSAECLSGGEEVQTACASSAACLQPPAQAPRSILNPSSRAEVPPGLASWNCSFIMEYLRLN